MPRFPPEFLDELKARLRPSEVIGRHVKLKKRGDTYWGLSPFKEEKTPSFTVSDRRGSYHCFATGKHGNIFDFLIETQRLSFPEAVERLAAEAGLELPRGDPADAERGRRRKTLVDACEAAAAYYAAMLRRADGRVGADYLKSRGVAAEGIEAFRLGYAPDRGRDLKDFLINKGFTEELLVEAGLIARPEGGGDAYDRFRSRVMFPIANARGEIIAFGGRALDPGARAKYLNSPETPLFHKSDVLYNFGAARQAAATTRQTLILCEGYMDVISLWQAGFKTAVAPLGTALTESHLQLLWSQCDEPVLCFDGDSAGTAAAYRSLDRALPLLKPGKSLAFAFLPDGQDPDDLIRKGGAEAFSAALARTETTADVLWRRETEARSLDTPERRAALRADLRKLVASIADKDVRGAYGAEIADRLNQLFAPTRSPPSRTDRTPRAKSRTPGGVRADQPAARISAPFRRAGAPSSWRRERHLVVLICQFPALIERHEAELSKITLENKELDEVLRALLAAAATASPLDKAQPALHLRDQAVANTLKRILQEEALTQRSLASWSDEPERIEARFSNALAHHVFETESRRDALDAAAGDFREMPGVAVSKVREQLRAPTRLEETTVGDDVPHDRLVTILERARANVERKAKHRK